MCVFIIFFFFWSFFFLPLVPIRNRAEHLTRKSKRFFREKILKKTRLGNVNEKVRFHLIFPFSLKKHEKKKFPNIKYRKPQPTNIFLEILLSFPEKNFPFCFSAEEVSFHLLMSSAFKFNPIVECISKTRKLSNAPLSRANSRNFPGIAP